MGRTVPALARSLDILELFTQDATTLSVPDITSRLELPRTTVHELVSTLVERGYLEPVPERPHHFQLGLRVFQLGSVYAERLDLARVGQRHVADVAASCDETVHLAVLDRSEVVYIAKVDSVHAVRMVSAVGKRLPAHCTAVGKMLLSGLSESALAALYPHDRALPAMTAHSVTSPALLRRELAEIQQAGIASEESESNPHVACVAAPVFDRTGAMVAAMSISVPTPRWSSAKRAQWSQLVADGADRLSTQLGHRTARPEHPSGLLSTNVGDVS